MPTTGGHPLLMVKPEYLKSAVKSRVFVCREKITGANRRVSAGGPWFPMLRAGFRGPKTISMTPHTAQGPLAALEIR